MIANDTIKIVVWLPYIALIVAIEQHMRVVHASGTFNDS